MEDIMKELELKYGCNPHQKPSRLFVEEGELPIEVLSGKPGYINFLDALNGWQLVKELSEATGKPAAASFKHVSPAGAAIANPLSDVEKKMYFVPDVELSPLACAYARARGADRMSSFGDWISLSDVCDEATARLIECEVSDGVIAPGYTEEALNILKTKRNGNYNVVKIDRNYKPAPVEYKQVFGITFEQGRNDIRLDYGVLGNVVTEKKDIPDNIKADMLIALITLKYTQSNSVCYAYNGQTVGVGAGQQSRIHCTRLAGNKADLWCLRHHDKVVNLPFKESVKRPERDNAIDAYISSDHSEEALGEGNWQQFFTRKPDEFTEEEKAEYLKSFSGLTLGSDAFFPFSDNIERAYKSGVRYIVQPGGSIRDQLVIDACNRLGIVMVNNGIRLFHH